MPETLYLKKNDLQPYYYFAFKDALGAFVNITGATVVCTMQNAESGALKITRRSTGITITDGANGQGELRWQAGDTDTPGTYYIEFECSPVVGGKFTLPVKNKALVVITESLDAV